MNCLECEELLQSFLDGEPVLAAMEGHLHECSHCRELFAAARALQFGLSHKQQALASPNLTPLITRSVLRDRARRRVQPALALGAVAAVLVCVLIWGSSPQRNHELVSSPAADPSTVALSAAEPSLGGNVEQAGLALADLTRRTAVETLEPSRVLLPELALAAPQDDGQSLAAISEESQKALDGVREGVAQGIEPLTSSARRAITLLRRDVPLFTADSDLRH